MEKTTEVVRECEYPDDSSIYLRYQISIFFCGIDFAFSKPERNRLCSGKTRSINLMNEMGGACSSVGEGKGMYRVLVGKPE
jgi:hypothetical protein